jgi:hypothetical protein
MKPFKMAAMVLAAGAGLALVSAQASADTVCGTTPCTATTSVEISAGVDTSSFTSSETSASQGTIGTGSTSTTTVSGSSITLGPTSSASSDSSASSFANGEIESHSIEWNKRGTATESSSSGSGESLAAVFVSSQNIVVHDGSELEQESGTNDTALMDKDFASVAGVNGVVLVNQSAGIGNQQGNLFATVAELSGASTGPNSGSNAINVTNAQNIIVDDESTMENDPYTSPTTCADISLGSCNVTSNTQPTGDNATITNSFSSVTGAVAVNQTVGVGNQQVNSILLAH